MGKNRFVKRLAVASGLIFLAAGPWLAYTQSAPRGFVRASNTTAPGTQSKGDGLSRDDFAGLSYTDNQKAELDKIHRDNESRKAAVVKDRQLSTDQKNAMLLGYTRMEYVQAFKVLSPEQQKQVRQRLLVRRSADHEAQKKQPPRN